MDRLKTELQDWVERNYEEMYEQHHVLLDEGIREKKINFISGGGTSLSITTMKLAINGILQGQDRWAEIADSVRIYKLMVEGFWGLDTFNDDSFFLMSYRIFLCCFFQLFTWAWMKKLIGWHALLLK